MCPAPDHWLLEEEVSSPDHWPLEEGGGSGIGNHLTQTLGEGNI